MGVDSETNLISCNYTPQYETVINLIYGGSIPNPIPPPIKDFRGNISKMAGFDEIF